MASGSNVVNYSTVNMTRYAAAALAAAYHQTYPNFRQLDQDKKIIVDDIEIPKECYPNNISQWSYNYISKTFNNIYGETAVDLLINMRMKVNWSFNSRDESVIKYWMGLINSRIFEAKNRDFKVNLYMPGLGWIESIWNTGAPIQGSAVEGSGHDGVYMSPGSSYYLPLNTHMLPGTVAPFFDYKNNELVESGDYARYYGSINGDANLVNDTQGVTDYSDFEIHWIERRGVRLNKVVDIDPRQIINS